MNNSSSMGNIKIMLMEQLVNLWRHKWIAVATCWVVCLLGWSAVMFLPRSYESDARAYVDVNGLLTPLLKGLVVEGNTAQTSDYLRQTLLSRPNLEQAIHLAQLDIGLSDVAKDGLIQKLSTDVQVKAQGRNLFTISYAARDPAAAKNVVESLLTIFAEKAASSNRVEMEKARKFLDDQIGAYEEQLRASEQKRAEFRKQYAEYLADPISGMPRLQTLAQSLNQSKQAYEQAVLTRDSLAAQLKQVPQFRPVVANTGGNGSAANPLASRLSTAEANLATLRLRFTDQHPDVIALKNEVADLQAQVQNANAATAAAVAAAKAAAANANNAQTAAGDIPSDLANPTYESIRLKLVDAQTLIPAAKSRYDQASAEFERARGMTAQIPDIDAKAKDLDRDYDIVKKNHDELVARRESANLSQAADDQADRTQFRIVDPPQVPLSPSFPNFPVMFSLVLVISIGAGIALPIAIELVRATFASALKLRDLGLPVIGAVTYVRRPGSTRSMIAGAAGIIATATVLLVVYGALMVVGSGIWRI
jgi:polysaccharide chain length determinant protein (PEP-CTERM system associated)